MNDTTPRVVNSMFLESILRVQIRSKLVLQQGHQEWGAIALMGVFNFRLPPPPPPPPPPYNLGSWASHRPICTQTTNIEWGGDLGRDGVGGKRGRREKGGGG